MKAAPPKGKEAATPQEGRNIQVGSVKIGCTSSTREPNFHVQASFPTLLPSDFELLPPVWCVFCAVRASGAYVPCDDLQKPYVSHIGSFACPNFVLSSLSQCSVSGLLSQGRRHSCLSRGGSGGPRLVMASMFVSSFLCARHFVLALWLCQLCLAAASLELGTLLLS